MTLLGDRELQRMARIALNAASVDGATQVEVVLESGTSALTRFANNYIHQNVQETDVTISVRALLSKRIGIAATDVVSDEGIADVARRAVVLAKLQASNEDFISLPSPTAPRPVEAHFAITANYTAEQRADVVRRLCEAASAANLVAAGAYRTAIAETAVANTLGVWQYHRGATADI